MAMQYMILSYESNEDIAARTDEKRVAEYLGGWKAFTEALRKAGILVAGAGLQPVHTATTVRLRDGKPQVQDGPFAETKEQLGGYYIIDVPSLDQALEWAVRCPAAVHGSVEVRPVIPPLR
jgi:hypothetical protein